MVCAVNWIAGVNMPTRLNAYGLLALAAHA
jgi:hypothetical protein